jgi:hypothetical protein
MTFPRISGKQILGVKNKTTRIISVCGFYNVAGTRGISEKILFKYASKVLFGSIESDRCEHYETFIEIIIY